MTYHDKLLEAYEGEIVGYTFFSALAQATEAADEKRKLYFLAGLETRTAAILEPLIERYNLTPRAKNVLTQEGVRDAAKYAGLDWVQLNARFVADFPIYVDEFLATEALAPPQDLRIMKLVTSHEIALINFAAEEVAGTDHGMGHLQSYFAQLEKYHVDLAAPPIVFDEHTV